MQVSNSHKRSPWRALWALLAALAAIGLSQALAEDEASAERQRPPNIVVLFTDDQEPGSLRVMKTVRKEVGRKGVTMKRFYTNFPLCCPSRATMLTGQYAHNHGVLSNRAPDGGFGVFDALHAGNSVNDWLQGAGYETGYIGKFLNGYAIPDEYGNLPSYVPPGWDDWRVLAPSSAEYFDYTLNQNGNLGDFGEEDNQYSTDKFTSRAKRFIRQSASASSPFFLMLGYAAPHGGGGGTPGRACNRGAVPAPRHLGSLRKRMDRYGFPPSFDEDVSDKPSPIAGSEPFTRKQIRGLERERQCAWESLLAVDESVGEILDQLKRSGERRDTYVFFTSDNGFLRGEHRIRNEKRLLYEESARVPFLVRGPGIARGERSANVVTNADLVSTLLEISGAEAGELQDGESLLPSFAEPKREDGRAILLEAFAGPEITGLRTSRYLYTEWDTGGAVPERELYDTDADPKQLDNLADDPAYLPVVNDLAAQLAQMADCEGAACRTRPSAELSLSAGGSGGKGCSPEPVVARYETSTPGRLESVEFRAGRARRIVDTAAPFEAVLPYPALRRELPDAAEVVARGLYADGRRVAIPAEVKACPK